MISKLLFQYLFQQLKLTTRRRTEGMCLAAFRAIMERGMHKAQTKANQGIALIGAVIKSLTTDFEYNSTSIGSKFISLIQSISSPQDRPG